MSPRAVLEVYYPWVVSFAMHPISRLLTRNWVVLPRKLLVLKVYDFLSKGAKAAERGKRGFSNFPFRPLRPSQAP